MATTPSNNKSVVDIDDAAVIEKKEAAPLFAKEDTGGIPEGCHRVVITLTDNLFNDSILPLEINEYKARLKLGEPEIVPDWVIKLLQSEKRFTAVPIEKGEGGARAVYSPMYIISPA